MTNKIGTFCVFALFFFVNYSFEFQRDLETFKELDKKLLNEGGKTNNRVFFNFFSGRFNAISKLTVLKSPKLLEVKARETNQDEETVRCSTLRVFF